MQIKIYKDNWIDAKKLINKSKCNQFILIDQYKCKKLLKKLFKYKKWLISIFKIQFIKRRFDKQIKRIKD